MHNSHVSCNLNKALGLESAGCAVGGFVADFAFAFALDFGTGFGVGAGAGVGASSSVVVVVVGGRPDFLVVVTVVTVLP